MLTPPVSGTPVLRVPGFPFPAALRWIRRGATPERTGLPGFGVGLSVQLGTERAAEPAVRARWDAQLDAARSAHKIYQMPAFFDAVRASDDGSAPVELLLVTRQADAALVAVVPVRIGHYDLKFNIGALVLFSRRIAVINLLGSVPAHDSELLPLSMLASRALALFPGTQAVLMPALQSGMGLWRQLQTFGPSQGVQAALLSDWRACHTMPVPASVDAYMQQFSSKKRYNLKRQIRQLATACGDISLSRIERTDQVPELFEALGALLAPETMGAIQRRTTLEAMASHGLLLCYVLRTGLAVKGVIVATRSADVLHIHNIFVNDSQRSLSVGTSTMQLAIEDIIGMACFKLIDYGFGTPKHEFSSSQVLETRAAVAVARRTGTIRHLLAAHRVFHVMAERAIAQVKVLRARWRRARASAPVQGA